MEKIKEGQKETKRGKKKWLILLLLLVALGSCMAWSLTREDGLFLDPDQSEGTLDGLSREEIQKLMNDKVDKSMLAISINSTPVFEDGKGKGSLRIENAANNNYNMRVRIVIDNEQKQIYYSDGIRPGQMIREDYLDEVLDRGTYACTATFEAYDEDGKKAGEAKAQLNIVVKK